MGRSSIYGILISIGLLTASVAWSAPEDGGRNPSTTAEETCSDAPMVVAQQGGAPSPGESESSDIQERAVPRLGPGMAPRMEFEGAVMENNRLRPKPGYVLELLPGNRVIAKRAGGGSGGTWDVKCSACTKKGKCEPLRSPDGIFCLGECTGSCNITISPAGGGKLQIQ